jgi:hypothetical protein
MSFTTLLTLPREIRNIIYTHLAHDITLDWGYCMFPFPIGGHRAVRLQVYDAPLPDVLLTCAQIYHEYRQDKRFETPSITINVSEDCTWRLLEGEPTNQARAFKVLGHVHRLEFSIDSTKGENGMLLWQSIDELSQAIGVLAPKLEIIRVVARPLTPHTSLEADMASEDAAISPPVLAGCLLSYGQQAYWNNSADLLQFFEAGHWVLPHHSATLTGEWLFTRGKGSECLGARRQHTKL